MENKKNLSLFRGWLLAFILIHMPLALYNFMSGVYAIAGFLGAGGTWLMAILNMALSLLLPVSLLLLLWRKEAFRYAYVAYCAIMVVNYMINTYNSYGAINLLNIIIALGLTMPWIIYIFKSKRVKAVLAAKDID